MKEKDNRSHDGKCLGSTSIVSTSAILHNLQSLEHGSAFENLNLWGGWFQPHKNFFFQDHATFDRVCRRPCFSGTSPTIPRKPIIYIYTGSIHQSISGMLLWTSSIFIKNINLSCLPPRSTNLCHEEPRGSQSKMLGIFTLGGGGLRTVPVGIRRWCPQYAKLVNLKDFCIYNIHYPFIKFYKYEDTQLLGFSSIEMIYDIPSGKLT